MLLGWGPFKIGMSRDLIIADMGNRATRAQVGPRLICAADINGTPYSASLAFDGNLRLTEIYVSQQDTTDLKKAFVLHVLMKWKMRFVSGMVRQM